MTQEQRFDLGLVDAIEAETFGEPGQRTFNVSVRSARGEAKVWMEKEQLLQLSVAIRRLAAAAESPGSPEGYVPEYAHAGDPVAVDFKIGDMRLRYDEATDVFTLEATDSRRDDDEGEDQGAVEEPTTVQFAFRRAAAEELAETATRIVSAGRPLCPFCHGPMDAAGHICPRSNGHHRVGAAPE